MTVERIRTVGQNKLDVWMFIDLSVSYYDHYTTSIDIVKYCDDK